MSEIVGEQALGRVEKAQTGPLVNLWAVGVACLAMLLNMSVNYLRRVVLPRSRGRRVE